jgi:hypothetical protein
MNKEVPHNDYYLELAILANLPLHCIPMDKVRTALAEGDEHLNSIALNFWDGLAVTYKGAIARANKQRDGQATWSLCDGVCAFKALARHKAQENQS